MNVAMPRNTKMPMMTSGNSHRAASFCETRVSSIIGCIREVNAPAAAPGLSMLFDEPAAPVEIEARPATPGAPPAWLRDGVMVDRLARGLYFYDRDTRPGRSTCYRTCRSLWPPLFAEADARPAGDFSVIERSDGTRQWAWQGKPLYRWVSDRRWGQADGDRVSGVWTLVRPTGADAAALPPFPDAP